MRRLSDTPLMDFSSDLGRAASGCPDRLLKLIRHHVPDWEFESTVGDLVASVAEYRPELDRESHEFASLCVEEMI